MCLTTETPKYIKQKLTEFKRQIENSKKKEFNIPLSKMGKTMSQKTNREKEDLAMYSQDNVFVKSGKIF